MRVSSHGVVKRLFVTSLDGIVALVAAMLLIAGFSRCAFAYVDPSVMTYTIQALAGVAVALSAVIGVVWRRVRRVLLKVLRIDENAGKWVDSEVHRLDRQAADYREKVAHADEEARRMKRHLGSVKPEQLGWGARLFFSFMAFLMLFFTIVVVGPLEIVASSAASLLFVVNDVWTPLAITALACVAVCSVALSLLKGRVFGVCFAVVVAIGVASYVQAMFLNTSLPSADGTAVAWDDYTFITVISAVVWIVLIVAAVVFSLKKSLLFKGVATTLCFVCIVAQTVGMAVLFATPDDRGVRPVDVRPTVTMDGVLDVSSKGNVIMFVLDTFDERYLESVVAEDPSALDEFTGFTYFSNSTGSMIPTRYALASLLTGQSLDEGDEAFSNSLIIDWYTNRNLIDDINDLGYQTDIYATDIYDAIGALSEKVDNVKPLERSVDPFGTVMTLVKSSLYRDLPWVLKPPFWFYTDELNNAVLHNDADDLAASTWEMNDSRFYELLEGEGLKVEDIGDEGSFRVVHMAGTHSPYVIDRNAKLVEGGTSLVEQGLGSLHIVSCYLQQLKQLGLYDEATIIVTADHGEWYLADEITGPTSPILFVKPSTEAGGSNESLVYSSVPTGHIDIAATLLEEMGGSADGYDGMNVFAIADEERIRYYNATSVDGPEHEYTYIRQWEVNGDALDWNDWRETGVKWPIE